MSQFSYLSREFKCQQEGNVSYIIDAGTPSLPIYFAIKGKHEYEMLGTDQFVAEVKAMVERMAANFDIVVFPESRYSFLKEITKDLKNAIELKKRNKEEICSLVKQTKGWKKQDILSAEKSWEEMGSTFTINKIKANKRKDYIPFLFEDLEIESDKNILLLDDFIMSGNTIDAMVAALKTNCYSVFGVFYQTGYKK